MTADKASRDVGLQVVRNLFKVAMDANKLEIKRAVEELFNVRVMAVNTMRRKGKKKRLRTARYGTTAASKRAVVTLHADDSINLI